MLKASFSRTTLLAWAMLGIGLLATIFASLHIKQDIEQHEVRQFAVISDQVAHEIEESLFVGALILRGGAFLFEASEAVDRQVWRAYVDSLKSERIVSGGQTIGFAKVIPAVELATHIANTRAEGFPEYTVRPISKRPVFTSIIYIEPFRGQNLPTFGFDMFSQPVRRVAMEQARDTGQAALSGKVEVDENTGGEAQAETLIFVPVYRKGMPVDTVGQRRAALIGWVYKPYHINDFMADVLAHWASYETKTLDLRIYDGLQIKPASLLFDSKPASIPDVHSLFFQQRTINFNGHQWLLVLDHISTLSWISYAPAWATLIFGLALNGILFVLMLSVINTRANAIRIAEELTEDIRHRKIERDQAQKAIRENEIKYRSLFETANDGIFLQDTTGFLDCNEKGARMYGLAKENIIGCQPNVLSPESQPDGRLSSEVSTEKMQAALEGESQQFEWQSLHSDGSVFDVEITLNRLELSGGVYLQAIVRDITERKKTEKYEQFRSYILEQLARNESLSSILEAIALGVEKLNPVMLCSISLMDSKGKHLHKGAAPSLPDFFNSALDGIAIGLNAGFCCGAAAFTGDRVIVADMAMGHSCVSSKELAANAGLVACWSQPIRSSLGKVLGTFTIYHHQPRMPAESDIVLMEQSARLIAIAIEHKQSEEAVRAREERFQILFDRASDGIIIISPNGKIVVVNESFARMHGYTTQELQAMNLMDLDTPETLELLPERMQRLFSGEPMTFEVENYHKDGHVFPLEISASLIFIEGEPLIQSFVRDITERKQAEEKLYLAASVFTHALEGIMITAADGAIIEVNDAFSNISGYSRDEVRGRNPRFLNSGRQENEFYAAMWRDLINQGIWSGEIWNRRKNGEMYAEMLTISAVRDAQGKTQHYVALFTDITPFKEHERQLEQSAHFDTLTSLPNRVLLADRLQHAMVQAQRRGQRLAVAFLDLDGFKAINDNHGHEAGDQLLIALATSMKQTLREGDTLARLGGDEFVAVLHDLADIEASVPMLTRLLGAAAQSVYVDGQLLQVSASLGVTFYPQAEDFDADQLLRQADQAMYQAKLAGKNRYHFFDAEQDSRIRNYHESLDRVRRALTECEFVLYYQPKVNMRSGTVIGAEALIRWQHPDRGLLLPTVFLPTIEDHPLAIDIGEWVIDTALAQMEIWQAAGLNIPVSVNIGSHQLQQTDFVERLRVLLAAHPNVRQGYLELEVLETSALEDLVRVSEIIEDCRKIGVSFSLDDFGTGYSSLTYLKRLHVTQVKIDQSFVSDMLDNPDDLAILEGVLGMASTFQHHVIAEGVETLEHGEMLLQFGCELAQGFVIAHPMPAHEMLDWSAAWHTDPSWAGLPALIREDLPLLVASVEHRAWIAALGAFLKGAGEVPPSMDRHKCRFGRWLDARGLIRYDAQPAIHTIERLHRQVHVLGAELLKLQSLGRNSEALARLCELHDLRDHLLTQLKTLVLQNRYKAGKEA